MIPENVQYIDGDIFAHMDDWDIMCHQVNCLGAFGRGIAYDISQKFPRVKQSYVNIVSLCNCKGELLGTTQLCAIGNGKYIANLFGQYDYGASNTKIYTDYNAFENALKILEGYAYSFNVNKIAFPFKIGCGLSNGDWQIIESYIFKFANSNKNFQIKIYKLE